MSAGKTGCSRSFIVQCLPQGWSIVDEYFRDRESITFQQFLGILAPVGFRSNGCGWMLSWVHSEGTRSTRCNPVEVDASSGVLGLLFSVEGSFQPKVSKFQGTLWSVSRHFSLSPDFRLTSGEFLVGVNSRK